MKSNNTYKLVLAGLFMSLGIILPFFTAGDQKLGSALLLMHIPILLCGFICGWQYGLTVGFITPLLRSLLFSAPPMPKALAMAFELAVYGIIAGLLYKLFPKKILFIFVSLITSMIGGRIVLGIVNTMLLGNSYTFDIFLSESFVAAIPGIIIQLIIIPVIILTLNKEKLLPKD